MEEWKNIGVSHYEVSTLGNVRNTHTGLILKPRACPKKGDYVCYDTYLDLDGNGQKHYKIHRLVALAFLPNPDNKTEIDHIDRNPANNAVSNLRWSSRSEQCFNSRTRSDNKLGERCIQFVKDGRAKPYKVHGVRFEGAHFFATLEEAVAYRDEILSA